MEDKDYSHAYQDEYQRLWHKAAAERDALKREVELRAEESAAANRLLTDLRTHLAETEREVERLKEALEQAYDDVDRFAAECGVEMRVDRTVLAPKSLSSATTGEEQPVRE